MTMNQQLLNEISDVYDKHCVGCPVKAAIKKVHHGEKATERYCELICPTGKKLRDLGSRMELERITGKHAELNEKNFRAMVNAGLSIQKLAIFFGISTSSVSRRKEKWDLQNKFYKKRSIKKEHYLQERAEGLSRIEIAEKWGIDVKTLDRWVKERWKM